MRPLLHHFRPQRTDLGFLDRITVAREHLIDNLLGRLSRWQPGADRLHTLLVGPRGIGKTHFMLVVEHRIRTTPALGERWLCTKLGEEEHRILGVGDLLLRVLELAHEETADPELGDAFEKLRYDEEDDRVVDLALDALRRYCRSNERGIWSASRSSIDCSRSNSATAARSTAFARSCTRRTSSPCWRRRRPTSTRSPTPSSRSSSSSTWCRWAS